MNVGKSSGALAALGPGSAVCLPCIECSVELIGIRLQLAAGPGVDEDRLRIDLLFVQDVPTILDALGALVADELLQAAQLLSAREYASFLTAIRVVVGRG